MNILPIDIHTHYPTNAKNGEAVISLSVGEASLPSATETVHAHPDSLFSIGLHPWHINAHWQRLVCEQIYPLIRHPRVIAVGEAGIDRLRGGGEWPMQLEAFICQAQLAAQTGKPLVIHCVKAFDELIRLHKESFSKEKWIIHGFRGKKEQAAQLIQHGFYLSFGEHCHKESLQSCPVNRLFLETDESGTPIQELYRRAASWRETDPASLMMQLRKNAQEVFSLSPPLAAFGAPLV